MVELSIVSPVFQAEKIISSLVSRIVSHLDKHQISFEVLLIDDGSSDNSWAQIVEQCKKDPRIHGIQLSRNFGQHPAISAGIDQAQGNWVVVMDCDLQDRPEEIFPLFQKAQEGYDIVFAQRISRQDNFRRRISSQCFYGFLSFLTGIKQDPTISNFGIYHRKVIESVLMMKENIRFFPAMINWVGFQKTYYPVEHLKRFEGKSSYNYKRLFKLALDILLAYSNKPLRLIIYTGFSISFISFLAALFMLIRALRGKIAVSGYASLIISVAFLSGITIFVLGIIGLYIGKIFENVKNRPIYLIRNKS